MNKRKAQERADRGDLTIGQLRQAIAAARGYRSVSTVNGSVTHDHALDVYLAALADRPDDETPAMWRPDPYSSRGAMKPTRDRLIVVNILRDCGDVGSIAVARVEGA